MLISDRPRRHRVSKSPFENEGQSPGFLALRGWPFHSLGNHRRQHPSRRLEMGLLQKGARFHTTCVGSRPHSSFSRSSEGSSWLHWLQGNEGRDLKVTPSPMLWAFPALATGRGHFAEFCFSLSQYSVFFLAVYVRSLTTDNEGKKNFGISIFENLHSERHGKDFFWKRPNQWEKIPN